jgi:hypothetical protein
MDLWWCMWVWQEAGCALEEVDGELRRQEAEGRALSIRYTYNKTETLHPAEFATQARLHVPR